MLIDPCGRRLLRELSSVQSLSRSCELGAVLCVATFGVWECSKSSGVKRFFLAI